MEPQLFCGQRGDKGLLVNAFDLGLKQLFFSTVAREYYSAVS